MLGCTPFTRLTNALSKKVQNHAKCADVISTTEVIKYVNALPDDLFQLPKGVPDAAAR
jgi:hypothetical protein